MAEDQKKFLPINYTNREFSEIRQDLLEMAERFYPDTFQDFSEASFGAMMLDAVAYVGDQLNFYLDYNINESFLDTSFQYSNVVRHGRALGYKATGRSSTFGEVNLYVQIPASSAGLGPDTRYIPILKRGSRFTSKNGLSFMLIENIDFNEPSNPIITAQVNSTTGAPTYYAIKASGRVVSGKLGQQTVKTGAFERFKKVALTDRNIVEIISVFDTEGNQYYEVEYLAQDMVYKEITNDNFKNDNVPSILKPMLVSRKFVTEHSRNGHFLQFGSGDANETDIVASPQSVAIDVFGKNYVTNTSFDPTRLSKNISYGIVPSNTSLYIVYRTTNNANSNVSTGAVNKVSSPLLEFSDRTLLSDSEISTLVSSLEVSNPKPITGDVTSPSTSEIKRRIYDTFPTQNRAVTQADYENIAYRMPAKYGSIKRCVIIKDQNSMKRNLNMYVISENSFGKMIATNKTIKQNLQTWLNNYRMINDTIDILDPYIINLGIDFVIKLKPGHSRTDIQSLAVSKIRKIFAEGFFISEAMYVSSIYTALKDLDAVLDVTSVKVNNKSGGQYSPTTFVINKNMSPDGSQLLCPANAIFEIKYPEVDIRGKIK
mgnify:CR=1 FL=1|tara:strand:- start:540 stop:2336 length:1797 start_codon:yes stop_codon:yes gene_type:complete